jgi:type I restriction enzyme R subunit
LIGKGERATQNRLAEFFQQELGYCYLGNWEYQDNSRNIEQEILTGKTRLVKPEQAA